MTDSTALNPSDISWEKKLNHIRSLSEDDFRDSVIRPLYERLGLKHLRRTCGPEEEGKDAIFSGTDSLRRRLIYAIQAKKGNINKASKAAENLLTATNQVRTALETDIYLTVEKQRVRPDCVILCASGIINEAAKRHIHDDIKDSRIQFMDGQDLIPLIDVHFQEFWYGIDAKLFPYLRALKRQLLNAGDTVVTVDLGSGQGAAPITDDAYVTLFVHRITEEIGRKDGQVSRRPKLDQIPIKQLLARPEKLVWIRGEGGSGKTTALRRLALELIDSNLKDSTNKSSHIPVLLPATQIANYVDSLAVLALAETSQLSSSGESAISNEDLSNGRLVILVDALDEVQLVELRRVAVEKLVEFHQNYPKCRIILTSREYSSIGAIEAIQGFEKYQIDSLDLRQAAKIVDRLSSGRKLNKDDANEMLRRLQEVHGIALSPMLVTVFVATSDFKKRDIPPNITEIFAKYTELLLGRWDERKGLAQQYESKLKDAVICQIAAEMHRYFMREISVAQFKSIATEYLNVRGYESEAETIIDEILSRSNLIRVEDGQAVFRHHILQEFFAGRGIDDAAQLAGVVDDEWWRKPIIFHFGDRPRSVGNMAPLQSATDSLAPAKRFEAAVTIGLATQACYLSETTDKRDILRWVIKALATALPDYLAKPQLRADKFPLNAFLMYYLGGREAVSCDCAVDVFKEIIDHQPAIDDDDPNRVESWERETFWAAVGLIESGHAEEAVAFVRKFKPSDNRLLLGLHLGAFFIAHHRISPESQKRAALEMYSRITDKIRYMLVDMNKEFKSFLLELKDGEVVAHDASQVDKTDSAEHVAEPPGD